MIIGVISDTHGKLRQEASRRYEESIASCTRETSEIRTYSMRLPKLRP